MLQIAMLLLGAAGLIQLFQLFVQKKQILKPALVEKYGEQKARTMGVLLSTILIAIAVIGFIVSLSWSK